MWLFAALIVLAMGGVAMLAAGYGTPLSEETEVRVPSDVPADRHLQAVDLRRVRFSLGFRGYRMSEVDDLLDRLASEQEAPPRTKSVDRPENDPAP